jgi:hypothetical protein
MGWDSRGAEALHSVKVDETFIADRLHGFVDVFDRSLHVTAVRNRKCRDLTAE